MKYFFPYMGIVLIYQTQLRWYPKVGSTLKINTIFPANQLEAHKIFSEQSIEIINYNSEQLVNSQVS